MECKFYNNIFKLTCIFVDLFFVLIGNIYYKFDFITEFFSWEVILYISRDFMAYHYENVVKFLMEITSLKILDWK